MFENKHYVPILKAKEGEFKALEVTRNQTKNLMTPLLEIVSIPWDYEYDVEGKDINAHLGNVGKKILDNWGTGRRIFIDSNYLESQRLMNDGITHHMEFLFNDFRLKNIEAIPATSLTRHQRYKEAIRLIKDTDGKGICLRLNKEDIGNPALLLQKIDQELDFYNIGPEEVDLIIDFRYIGGTEANLTALVILTTINNTLPYINNWRSLTFASAAFPVDLRDIVADSFDTLERTDWIIWNMLQGFNLKRYPAYGDFSIANPDIVEGDPRILTVSANIRYTCDNYWLIARGRSTKTHGYEQYYSLSEELIQRPEYLGSAFSWGDNYINECAARRVGTGNQTTWRKVANNHHFEKTVNQISNLP